MTIFENSNQLLFHTFYSYIIVNGTEKKTKTKLIIAVYQSVKLVNVYHSQSTDVCCLFVYMMKLTIDKTESAYKITNPSTDG